MESGLMKTEVKMETEYKLPNNRRTMFCQCFDQKRKKNTNTADEKDETGTFFHKNVIIFTYKLFTVTITFYKRCTEYSLI